MAIDEFDKTISTSLEDSLLDDSLVFRVFILNDELHEVPSDITSTDKQCNSEDEGTTTDPTPSSSTMINFEFINGHSYVPSPSYDQDYVEYPLEHVEGFPCNAQEEERMLMEAVLLSLKDLEPKQPKKEEQPISDSKSPVTSHIAPIKTDTTTRDSTSSNSESPYGVKINFNPIKYCAHYGMTCLSINVFGLKQTIVMFVKVETFGYKK
ncbi:hypothetical protein Tco_1438894 [Tanacetum coccineum]